MEYKDYYKTLGVDKKASDEEIKKAFRNLAKQYHPDHNPGDKKSEEKFKEINEAYAVLKDKEKRARYDQLGSSYSAWEQQGGSSANYDWSDWVSQAQAQSGGAGSYGRYYTTDFDGMGGFSDFFSQIFGGMGSARRTRTTGASDYESLFRQNTPAPQQHEVVITLMEAFNGTERVFSIEDKKYEAKIPAGAATGTKIRLAGVLGKGNQKADLILVVKVENDLRFERKGDDLYTDVQVDLFTALLGGESVVQSINEQLALKIPAGTQPDQLIRLTGKGMPKLKGKNVHGDLYARIRVQIPRDLTQKQRELFEQARKS